MLSDGQPLIIDSSVIKKLQTATQWRRPGAAPRPAAPSSSRGSPGGPRGRRSSRGRAGAAARGPRRRHHRVAAQIRAGAAAGEGGGGAGATTRPGAAGRRPRRSRRRGSSRRAAQGAAQPHPTLTPPTPWPPDARAPARPTNEAWPLGAAPVPSSRDARSRPAAPPRPRRC